MRLSLLLLALALGACDSISNAPEATFGVEYTVLESANSPAIRDVRVDGRVRVEVQVEVEYRSECKKHGFVLRERVEGKRAEVWFVHDAEDKAKGEPKGDDCHALQRAFVRETLSEIAAGAESITLLAPPDGRPLPVAP